MNGCGFPLRVFQHRICVLLLPSAHTTLSVAFSIHDVLPFDAMLMLVCECLHVCFHRNTAMSGST